MRHWLLTKTSILFSAKKRKIKSSLWLHRPKKTPKLSTVKESEIAATPVQTKNVLNKPNSTELKTAPLKKKGKIKTTRRKLYKENTDGKVVADMINILPSVLNILNRVMFQGIFAISLEVSMKKIFRLQIQLSCCFLTLSGGIHWIIHPTCNIQKIV